MKGDLKPAITVKNLTKSFRIPLEKGRSIKSRILGRSKKGYREFTPLNDISFTIYEGDFFGIVGRNGSGKSTLLKTIAGIYEPTKGKVSVNGTLVPFIELGVGFNPQLTGRDNVYLNAAMLGFSRDEIDDMYDEIVDFAELHDFMEERLQNYSSGMQVRLAFSIAIQAKGNVLLLDEVLAVGDAAFQRKCLDYFEKLKKDGRTVILVTHSMANVEQFCNRALLLDEGKIKTIGSSNEVAEEYRKLFSQPGSAQPEGQSVNLSDDGFRLIKTYLTQGGVEVDRIKQGSPFSVEVEVEARYRYSGIGVALKIRNQQNLLVFRGSTNGYVDSKETVEGGERVRFFFALEDNYYTDGVYTASVTIWAASSPNESPVKRFEQDDAVVVRIEGVDRYPHSLFHPPYVSGIKRR